MTSYTNSPFYDEGDFIEFKRNISFSNEYEYVTCKGKIINTTNKSLLVVKIIKNNKDLTKIVSESICHVNPLSIVNHYPKNKIPKLTLRLVLKQLWKNFIFREVKTTKTKDVKTIIYKYVNEYGFSRFKTFNDIPTAYKTVPKELQKNIRVYYEDFYGFTINQSYRSNDIYHDQEIFFSKKCHGELNLVGTHISGKFHSRRKINILPPKKKQYICGLVGNGERGLFYKKWFVCSHEFLILWTMICEPGHHCLKKNENNHFTTKSLAELLYELNMHKKNENLSIHNGNIYQNLAKILFKPSTSVADINQLNLLYKSYEKELNKCLMWMKK